MRRLIIVSSIFFLVCFSVFVIFQFDRVLGWLAPDYETATVIINGHEVYVDVALDDFQRAQGLSGRETLAENNGMLFVFDKAEKYSFWMKDMNFSLDFVWIRNGVVVGVTQNVPVPAQDVSLSDLKRYSNNEPFDMVLEINSGMVQRYNIEVGDNVNVISAGKEATVI